MPPFSSCARKERHTRAGGATSAGSRCATETMLLKSAASLWRPLIAPKGAGSAMCSGGRPPRVDATCVFLSCMVFPPAARHRILLLIDSESLRRIFRQGGVAPPPLPRIDLSVSGRYSRRDLVESRVGDVIGFNLGRPFNYCGEKLRHFWVRCAIVSLGILRCVPQTDSKCFPAALSNERDFVLEPFLFSEQRKDVLL